MAENKTTTTAAPTVGPLTGISRYDIMPKPLKVVFLTCSTIGIALFIYYMFGFTLFELMTYEYYFLLYALFSVCIFLTLPARKRDRNRVPWYDLMLAGLSFGIFLYFYSKAWSISEIGWIPPPSTLALALASIFSSWLWRAVGG